MKRVRFVAGLLVALTLGAFPVAQAIDPPGPRVVFQHDGWGVTGFALYVRPDRGQEQRFDLGYLKPDATGMLSAPLPQLPPGRYALAIVAYNASGESPRVSASPARLTVAPDKSVTVSAEPVAAAPSPSNPTDPSAPTSNAAAPKSGFWSRFWILLVGED